MVGIFDYTVILTYISALSAGVGIFVSIGFKNPHPYWAILCLMICGLCDTFDGRVARTKKNRTEMHKNFGIQIDSLSDLLAFGVLPACIGFAIYNCKVDKQSELLKFDWGKGVADTANHLQNVHVSIIVAIGALFILAALIRLAYFNVTCDETQAIGQSRQKYYYGLPVTTTAIIFPTFMLANYKVPYDLSFIYYFLLIIVGVLFVSKFKLVKPKMVWIYILVGIGALEFIAVFIARWIKTIAF